MSTLKVNTIGNKGSAVDFPNKLKVRGNAIEQGYTASGTEPSSPSEGDYWWDSTNEILYQYINSEFKTISFPSAGFAWGGDRAIISGGRDSSSTALNNIEYYDITTTGNAADFGDLTVARVLCAACSSTERALIFNGYYGSGTDVESIDYVAIATLGNAADFGDSLHNKIKISCASDGTYGFHIGGQGVTTATTGQIGRVTISTLGDSTDFGDLTTNADYTGAVYGASYVHVGGGDRGGYSNVIDYFATVVAGNASDFGDLTSAREEFDACGDTTRGVWCGGRTSGSISVNTMDYVTLGTAANASDFGDLAGTRRVHACTSNETYGTINGGMQSSTLKDQIMYFTIQTTGNASDFGDLSQDNNYLSACSGNAS